MFPAEVFLHLRSSSDTQAGLRRGQIQYDGLGAPTVFNRKFAELSEDELSCLLEEKKRRKHKTKLCK